jgi:GT2 family glycosyltransferase
MPTLTSILIVTYNAAAFIRGCLSSLADQTLPRHRFEVIVYDNASADESAAIVEREFPWVRLVKGKSNVGFAEGNNVAKQYAHGDRLILLNPDTIADPHWLAELDCDAETHSRIASKLVLNPDGRTINSAGIALLRSGWAADVGFRQCDRGQFEQARPVFAGCGAASMIPNRPGPIFPADYFTYYEDVANGWAASRDGEPTRYSPRAVVMHCCGAGANEQSPRFQYWSSRNRLIATATFADPFLAIWAIVKFAIGRPSWPRWLALGSFAKRLPKTLVERYDARSTRP